MTKSLLFVILFILSLTFVKPVFADRTINSATLNGTSSVTVAPSTSITAAVNVTTNTLNDKNWRSTSWNISGSNCINHADHNGAGTYNESFTVTAPSSSGTYNISFIAYADSACSSDPSSTFTLIEGIIVASPTPTPGPTATPTPTPVPGAPTATPTPTSSSSSSSSSTYYPSVSLNTYAPNPTNKAPLTFQGLAAIEQETIALVEYTLTEGTTWIPAQPVDGSFNGKDEHFIFTTANLTEGTYTMKVRAKSSAGVYTSDGSYASQIVTIATTPPRVTVDTITPNPTKNQSPTIRGSATTTLVAIKTIEISIDGGNSWLPTRRSGATFNATLSKLEDGNYPIIARAIDAAGNVGQSSTQILIIDTIPPIIGGGMQSLGPLTLTPDTNGMVSIVSGAETTIAISMKGGVTNASIHAGSDSFPLTLQEGTSLWVGKIIFPTTNSQQAEQKSLIVSAVDGAGNKTERPFHTLLVDHSGTVENEKTKQAIQHATVSLFMYETISKQWVLWEAPSYGQVNPQQTDDTGTYNFMVPNGKYYIEAKAKGYKTTQSEIITTTQTTALNYTLPLRSKPTVEWTLPLFGKILLTLPTFSPPEVFPVSKNSALTPDSTASPNDVGFSAPNFVLPNLENTAIPLTTLRGKKLLLSFLSPWSLSSQEQAPLLSELSLHMEENQAVLVVSLQESVAATETFMKKGNYQFPVVADKNGTTAADYHISLLPHHVFIDENGTIANAFTGVLTQKELLKKLSDMP